MIGNKLVKYIGLSFAVIIPQKINVVEAGAFKGNALLNTVVILKSVSIINADAFCDCTNLK